jgi:threonine dehydrogenase-like Zn-dependent dehydrogenase
VSRARGAERLIAAHGDAKLTNLLARRLSDPSIITTLCPGGKERMRRLMSTIATGRVDLWPLVTHRFKLDQIEQAYELFGHQRDRVLKVAITP